MPRVSPPRVEDEHPDINSTHVNEGIDAVRERHDKAQLYRPNAMRKANGRIIPIIAFDEIKLGTARRYAVGGLIPRTGLVVVWGPPKSGKSFWTFDLAMHMPLGWSYRGRRTQKGAVVYCAFEGQSGFQARVEAFRQKHLNENQEKIPFYLVSATLNLVRDHKLLITTIKGALNNENPTAVVLDTLNRSLQGSESSDEDMTAYIQAADAIRETFDCVVIIVHHCGVDERRPRGHTSLTGACDAQLSVKRDQAENIIVELECAKDGPQGDKIASRLEQVVVGTDEDGEQITTCIVVPVEIRDKTDASEPRLTRNQQTMFSILHDAGAQGLSTEVWYERTREAGIGTKRKADLYDIRSALVEKGLTWQTADGWTVKHSG
jgi:AAA domain